MYTSLELASSSWPNRLIVGELLDICPISAPQRQQ
jgi:hypothetical protein